MLRFSEKFRNVDLGAKCTPLTHIWGIKKAVPFYVFIETQLHTKITK